MLRIYFFVCSSVIIFFACRAPADAVYNAPIIEETILDTMFVVAPRPIKKDTFSLPQYNPSARRDIDLLHTKLELSFDWENQFVLGEASLILQPYFYPINGCRLDAVGFDIHTVRLNNNKCRYEYDGRYLDIYFERLYKKEEGIEIYIDYTAKPNLNAESGSEAITSDKGLFFINPLGNEYNKPQQIWTQGETENNSRWFPTIDKPNERCTQEVYLTVDQKYQTLSNGRLITSIVNNNGTRTDYWKQDLPHAPYLFLVSVGAFAVVKDKWRDKELMYYVDKPYKENAKNIFAHTPEMLTFFSEILDYPFPWDKYAQIVVTDFVSGAMENTGAVTFGSFVQLTERDLIDNNNDAIVAHELFHHWFGDLVTCESWANLTMNEGFANYAEYLWFEHYYGRYRADHHRMSEKNGYLHTAHNQGTHPLIYYGYEDKEEMFDAHSYNKGGLVLHMLRRYVGDKAFFAALNLYLKRNEFSDVEADELRLAFEDTIGEDLNWFFDQWYFSEGHPDLYVSYNVDNTSRTLEIVVEQVQDPKKFPPIFVLPTQVSIYDTLGLSKNERIIITKRKQTFTFEISDAFAFASLDGNDDLLAEISDNKNMDMLYYQLRYSPLFIEKKTALAALNGNDKLNKLKEYLLSFDYHDLRSSYLSCQNSNLSDSELIDLAKNDIHSEVRNVSLGILGDEYEGMYIELAKEIYKTDLSNKVKATALTIILNNNLEEALLISQDIKETNSVYLQPVIIDMYARKGDVASIPYFKKLIKSSAPMEFYQHNSIILKYCRSLPEEKIVEMAKVFQNTALQTDLHYIQKFMSTTAIDNLRNHLENMEASKSNISVLTKLIEEIKERETNPDLISRYENL